MSIYLNDTCFIVHTSHIVCSVTASKFDRSLGLSLFLARTFVIGLIILCVSLDIIEK